MASDVLTQLQTCYDQLLTQFFSTVSYLSQRHPLAPPEPIPGDDVTLPPRDEHSSKPKEEDSHEPYALKPVSSEEFASAQRELAEDLVRKGQQIEQLIERLPGVNKNESQQAEEIRELVRQVKEMEKVRKQKRKEVRECVRQLDDVIMGMATSINPSNGTIVNGHTGINGH